MCVTLESCCCCLSLESGAQIISILSLLVALAETALCTWWVWILPLSQMKTTVVAVATAVAALFEGFCACLLIRGVFAKKSNWTIPWLVLAWVKSVLCLAVAGLGVALLVIGGHNGQPTTLDDTSTLAPQAVEAVEAAETTTQAPPVTEPAINVVVVAVVTIVCFVQALLLMYFALVVNSRRKQLLNEEYSSYAPVRSDSIVRNFFVPMTTPVRPSIYWRPSNTE